MNDSDLRVLLDDMTLEEKIGQLLQVNSSFYNAGGLLTGPQQNEQFSRRQLELAGSLLGTVGAEHLIRFQDSYMETQPHRIPMLFMADIINGYKTVFPIPLAQGATFNPELAGACAAVAARESAAAGIHVTFSPMADLVRDARWGRVMESTGEDVYLNSCFSSAVVRGYQGGDVSEKGRVAACVKHFAAYGAPLAGREYNQAEISERTLMEEYLPSFRAAIEAGVKLVMTSFQTLGRIPCTGNRKLMRDTLRAEMNFRGVLISDWKAVDELIAHGVAADGREAAKLAIEAGVDIDMMADVYVNELAGLIDSGEVSRGLLDEAVLRVLSLKNDLGLFEHPYKDADPEAERRLMLCKEHRRAAHEAAIQSFVLLKNEGGNLPLLKSERTAFLGPYINDQNIVGSWTIFADENPCVSIREGVSRIVPEPSAVFLEGCSLLDKETRFAGFRGLADGKSQPDFSAREDEALKLAAGADKVVLCLGEHRQHSGEGGARGEITLPQVQTDFLKKTAAVNPNITAVIFCGRPLDLRNVVPYAKSILVAWFPGSEGGSAIADVLYGEACPSGKLPMSFPHSVGQVPVYYSDFTTGRPYCGQPDFRFASKYLDIPNEPLYPFGFGLSYGAFAYSGLSLDCDILTKEGTVNVTVTVSNTGVWGGYETVQLYLRDIAASVARPVRELKGFRKIWLEPGASAQVTFAITEEMLRFYDINMSYTSEAGSFVAYVGGDSTAADSVAFSLI